MKTLFCHFTFNSILGFFLILFTVLIITDAYENPQSRSLAAKTTDFFSCSLITVFHSFTSYTSNFISSYTQHKFDVII